MNLVDSDYASPVELKFDDDALVFHACYLATVPEWTRAHRPGADLTLLSYLQQVAGVVNRFFYSQIRVFTFDTPRLDGVPNKYFFSCMNHLRRIWFRCVPVVDLPSVEDVDTSGGGLGCRDWQHSAVYAYSRARCNYHAAPQWDYLEPVVMGDEPNEGGQLAWMRYVQSWGVVPSAEARYDFMQRLSTLTWAYDTDSLEGAARIKDIQLVNYQLEVTVQPEGVRADPLRTTRTSATWPNEFVDVPYKSHDLVAMIWTLENRGLEWQNQLGEASIDEPAPIAQIDRFWEPPSECREERDVVAGDNGYSSRGVGYGRKPPGGGSHVERST